MLRKKCLFFHASRQASLLCLSNVGVNDGTSGSSNDKSNSSDDLHIFSKLSNIGDFLYKLICDIWDGLVPGVLDTLLGLCITTGDADGVFGTLLGLWCLLVDTECLLSLCGDSCDWLCTSMSTTDVDDGTLGKCRSEKLYIIFILLHCRCFPLDWLINLLLPVVLLI